jgi:hypothetical protein
MRTLPKIIAAAALLTAGAITSNAAAQERAQVARVQPAHSRPAPAKPYKVDCSISPDLCMTEPVARGCGEGKHWSAAGSGTAHCVEDDRDCADGKSGKRDEYDSLICADEKEAAEEAARKGNAEGAARAGSQQEEGRKQ